MGKKKKKGFPLNSISSQLYFSGKKGSRYEKGIGGENPRKGYLSNGFAMAVVKKTSRMGLLIVKFVTTLGGFEVGLETRGLSVVSG